MSSHSAYPWKHPRLNATGAPARPIRYMLHNPHGRRARQEALARYRNALARGLPAALPKWMGPKPMPPGPGNSVPKPNPKPTPPPRPTGRHE